MRIPLIAGNWKMNTTLDEAVTLATEIRPRVADVSGVEMLACPPFISLAAVRDVLWGSNVMLGAQNLHQEDKGAYTGEISGPMLVSLVDYVIIGHSERRQYYGEDGALVNAKILATQRAGLKPILCIGESLAQNQARETENVLRGQLREALHGVPGDGLTIAYEPVWAIGTGLAATSEQANQSIGFIRGQVAELYDAATADAMRILYGGSMNTGNAAALLAEPEIDGGLIGGACLKAENFSKIAHTAAAA